MSMIKRNIMLSFVVLFLLLLVTACALKTQMGAVKASDTYSNTESCTPQLSWKLRKNTPPTAIYDIAIYEALKSKQRGERVLYVEGVVGTSYIVQTPLKPDTHYLWSVRVRLPDGRVSAWSTYSSNDLIFDSYGNWFELKTPEACVVR